jgi:hypothetical protein
LHASLDDLRDHLYIIAHPVACRARAAAHIAGALNVPRGVLEATCEWDYDDTVSALAAARERPIAAPLASCPSCGRRLS